MKTGNPQLSCVMTAIEFSDDSIQMLEADVVFGTVIVSYPAKTGRGFNFVSVIFQPCIVNHEPLDIEANKAHMVG